MGAAVGFGNAHGNTDNNGNDEDWRFCSAPATWDGRDSRILTDDKQNIPLPPPRPSSALDGGVDLLVGIGHIVHHLLCTLVNLLDGGFLLLNEFGHLLV